MIVAVIFFRKVFASIRSTSVSSIEWEFSAILTYLMDYAKCISIRKGKIASQANLNRRIRCRTIPLMNQ